MKFYVLLCTALYLLCCLDHLRLDVHDALLADMGDELDHLFTNSLVDEPEALDSLLLFTNYEETLLSYTRKELEIISLESIHHIL